MDSQAMVAAVGQLARAAVGDFGLEEMLRALCVAAASALDVDGAGVMARDVDRNRFVHATTDPIGAVEKLQELLQVGPCATAVEQEQVVVVLDLATSGVWGDFEELAAGIGVRAVVAVPLLSRGRGWGVLDLYRHEPGPWTAELLRAAEVLADVAVSYVVMAHDREQARTAQQSLAHLATHDGLTGLPNRGLLFDRLEHALRLAARSQAAVAVVFVDLDRFKQVNDTYGHQVGDHMLVEVARRLRSCLRGADTVARYAGDEFVIVCEGLPGFPKEALTDRVTALTHRLERALDDPVRVGDLTFMVSASVGAAVTVNPTATAQQLLAAADRAMYDRKGPREPLLLSAPSAVGDADDYTQRLAADLVGAPDRGELRLFYQPIVTATDRGLAAVEALLRWERPGVGLVTAATFIKVAVDIGVIGSIGRWVLDESCAQLTRWRSELGPQAPPTVFINLSGRELADPTLPAAIAEALARHHLLPGDLGLEIVEDDLADAAALARLSDWQQAGHPLAVDDFGTGYSSVSRLLDLPVAIAKIDKLLVAGLPASDRSLRLIKSIVLMCVALNIHVAAEGIETADQAAYAALAGCDLLQGTHLGPPQDPDQLTTRWRRT